MWNLDKLIDKMLVECEGHNEALSQSLVNIRNLDEHGMPVGIIDVYSAFQVFVVRKHAQDENYDYEQWEKNCAKLLNDNYSKLEFSSLERRIKDLVSGFDR